MVAIGTKPFCVIVLSVVKTNTDIMITNRGMVNVNDAPSLVLRILLAWVSSITWSPENTKSKFLKQYGQKR